MWSLLRNRVAASLWRTQLTNDTNTFKRNPKAFGEFTKTSSIQCIQSANDSDHKNDKHHRKKTCNEQKHFYPQYDCSLLETVGWVGTALAIGVNYRLCNNSNITTSRDPETACVNTYFCKSIKNLLWGIVSASPDKLSTSKLALPQSESFHKSTFSKSTNKNEQERILASLNSTKQELAVISREYFGHLETLAGLEAIKTDSVKGLSHFKEGGKLGNAKSHFNLGVCYETGQGTEINLEKAAYHFQQASDGDHPLALFNLGVYYLEGRGNLAQDTIKGLQLIDKAAKLGVTEAKTHMGIHYFELNQWDLSFPLLKDASSKDPEAQYYLAYCYKNGLGVLPSEDLANEYFKLASASGFDESLTDDFATITCQENKKNMTSKTDQLKIHSQSALHSSLSTPNLSSNNTDRKIYDIAISRYLDIILPNFSNKPVDFALGNDFENEFTSPGKENQLVLLTAQYNNLPITKLNHLVPAN